MNNHFKSCEKKLTSRIINFLQTCHISQKVICADCKGVETPKEFNPKRVKKLGNRLQNLVTCSSILSKIKCAECQGLKFDKILRGSEAISNK